MKRPAVFAIPGDIESRTGGYVYERQLLLALRRGGRAVRHLALPGSYPNPSQRDLEITGRAFSGFSADTPVILDGFLPGATEPAVFASLRAPFVAITHHPLALETGLDPNRARFLHATERVNLSRASHVIVPSPHTARTLVEEFCLSEHRVTVVEPGVEREDEGVRGARDDTATPLILSVGQLVPRKGHDILLRALARIRELPWRAVIVGGETDPEHARALKELSATLGLSDRVCFAGSVGGDDLRNLYGRADLFALATRHEGYGMVFAEALVAGLPIVACAGGAARDTVPRDAGRIVEVGDVIGLADEIGALLGDRALRGRLAAAAYSHGARLPTWDDAARIVDVVLDRIAG